MPIAVTCSKCYSPFSVPDKFAGRKIRCKQCEADIYVPRPGEEVDDDFGSYDDDVAVAAPAPRRRSPGKKTKKKRRKSASSSDKMNMVLMIAGGGMVVLFGIFLLKRTPLCVQRPVVSGGAGYAAANCSGCI